MATDDDKESAWIRFEDETPRLFIRRPRLDRDGLYLFGRRFAAQTLVLDQVMLGQLAGGKTAAVDVQGQYILYIQVTGTAEGASRTSADRACRTTPDVNAGVSRGCRPALPTREEEVTECRLLRLNRQDRRTTPERIRRPAEGGDC